MSTFGTGRIVTPSGAPAADIVAPSFDAPSEAAPADTADLEIVNRLASINRHLERLDEKFVQAPALDAQTFNLAVTEARRFDFTARWINGLIVTAEFGVLFVYFGDYTSQSKRLTTAPHLVVSAQIQPTSQQFALPPAYGYIITVQATTFGPAGGSVIPMFL